MNNNLRNSLRTVLRDEAKRIMELDESLYNKVQQLEEIGNIMHLINNYFEKENER